MPQAPTANERALHGDRMFSFHTTVYTEDAHRNVGTRPDIATIVAVDYTIPSAVDSRHTAEEDRARYQVRRT